MARERHSTGARILALSIAPTLGIATAWLAGVFDLPEASAVERALTVGYAAACGWVLWRIVHGINVRLGWYRHWVRRPFGDTLLPAALNVVITCVGTAIMYLAWTFATGAPHDAESLQRILFMAAGATAVSNLGYRVSFVHALRVRAVRRIAKLERVAAQAQMSALKAQLDPHFLANSLNVFCHLAESHPEAATRFADNLSWIYRYVIENGQKDFVRLEEELEFVDRYVGLLRIRFGAGIDLRIRDQSDGGPRRWLPPLAMQTLIENAVKHNAFSTDEPLVFTVTLNAESVEVGNPVRARGIATRGEGLGLANLSNRVRLLTGLTVRVERRHEQFRVTVPLVEGATA